MESRYVVTAKLMFSNREDALKAASRIDGHEYGSAHQGRVEFDGLLSAEVVVDEI
ncbi:hypothetical protein AU152_gp29 [Mycobacterium phage Phlei]|uniref:Uncharacterized protein n=1 Tax=Mycobacterium phage Phlei TaxID=1690684 RepID=A0A0N7E4H6_9CAUD|nr:hypothetical protein AU152_gp29 [Mycobacterium phage Phlei]ALA48142.1 hypothetical protein [Mycobacterium phage Phlei]